MAVQCYWRVRAHDPLTPRQLRQVARVAARAKAGDQLVWVSSDHTTLYGEAPFDTADVDRMVRLSERVAETVEGTLEQSDSFETMGPGFELPEDGDPLGDVVDDLPPSSPQTPEEIETPPSLGDIHASIVDALADLASHEAARIDRRYDQAEPLAGGAVIGFESVAQQLGGIVRSDIALRVDGQANRHRVVLQQIVHDSVGRPVAIDTVESTGSMSKNQALSMTARTLGTLDGSPPAMTLRAAAFALHRASVGPVPLSSTDPAGGTAMAAGPLQVHGWSLRADLDADDDVVLSLLVDAANLSLVGVHVAVEATIRRGQKTVDTLRTTVDLSPGEQRVIDGTTYLIGASDQGLTATLTLRVESLVGQATFSPT